MAARMDLSSRCRPAMRSGPLSFRGTRRVLGYLVRREARVKLLIDRRRGFAMRALERTSEPERAAAIAVTDNALPEHMEDLWELGPGALVTVEYLPQQRSRRGAPEAPKRRGERRALPLLDREA